jgi:tetratricopeptide (TPR) repeat protein
MIYGELALLDTVPATSKPLIEEAKAAHKKAVELDKAGENKANLDNVSSSIFSQYELNQGVRSYQTNNFADAYTAFNNALAFRPGDTTITYYAGLSAINAKNYKDGISRYEDLIKTNFSANKSIYLDLSRLYSMEGDTAKAISIASEGAIKFNDSQLATQEIELSLMSGKQKEVITKISDQASKNPTNKLYPYYLGIAYSTIGEAGKAEESYLQAIKIDGNFADAYINVGGVLLNKAINLFNKANQLPQNQQKEYDAMIKSAGEDLEKAFPYLSKASELDPKSKIALENLKTYYIIKKNQAKIDEISAQIEKL